MRCRVFLIELVMTTVLTLYFTNLANATVVVDEALVEVSINGDIQPQWILVRLAEGAQVQVLRAELDQWGIAVPAQILGAATNGAGYVDLDAIPGVHGRLNGPASRLEVTVQPSLMQPHSLNLANTQAAPPTLSPPGVFANYDLTGTGSPGARGLSGLFEAGVFRGPVVANTTWLATSLERGLSQSVRLDSTLVADFPASRCSLRIGDGLVQPNLDGAQLRMAGVSWGTDFATTPEFITFPLPAIHGEAVVPSAVDLLVNGAPIQHMSVPAGPFTLERIPVPNGSGELSFMVRDALGREQVVHESYYAAQQLLSAGLSDWRLDLGARRQDFGLQSDSYAGWIAHSSWRRGLTDSLTGALQVAGDEHVRNVAAALTGALNGIVVWNTSLACAEGSGTRGCRIGTGLQQQTRYTGIGLEVTQATSEFATLTDSPLHPTPRTSVTGHLGLHVPRLGSCALFTSWRHEADGTNTSYWALSAGRTLGEFGHVDFLASRIPGQRGSSLFALQFTHRLAGGNTTSMRMSNESGTPGIAAMLEHNAPQGPGYGYQVSAERGDIDQLSARGSWNGEREIASAWVQQSGGQTFAQAGLSGALLWFASEPFLVRRLDQGFAVARVAGVSGLPIYHDGQVIAHTDRDGTALVTGLRPFERNEISVDPAQLPLSVDVAATSFHPVPFRRGGVLVDVAMQEAVSIRLVREEGGPVPPGAWVHTSGTRVPVGLDGLAFVQVQPGVNRFEITWEGGRCFAELRRAFDAAQPAVRPTDEPSDLVCRRVI
jgi:outer membrane usher protein